MEAGKLLQALPAIRHKHTLDFFLSVAYKGERETKHKNRSLEREVLHRGEETEEEEGRDKPEMRRKRDHGPMMDGRVVGGSDSPAYIWTFLVGIRRNGVFYCSGTLLSAYLVLTAAHCVHE